MQRFPNVDRESLDPERRRVHDLIQGMRTSVRGPFAIWLEAPAIAEAALRLQTILNYETRLDKRAMQLMILIVARRLSAEFAWCVHARHVAQLGIEETIVEAIRQGLEPPFTREDDTLVYSVTREICTDGRLSDDLFERAGRAWGRKALVELVAGIGFYHMVGMTLNVFGAQAPGGIDPFAVAPAGPRPL